MRRVLAGALLLWTGCATQRSETPMERAAAVLSQPIVPASEGLALRCEPADAEVSVNGGPPWDYAWDGPLGTPYELLTPAGGTRTILIGEERTTDGNNGCTASIAYGLTSFDAGDVFRVALDPENGGCGSAVVDIRSFLEADAIGIGVTFGNGVVLSGNDWAFELIDPAGSPNADDNQRYRLRLSAVIPNAVPEPATWGMMIAGLGLIGAAMRRRVSGVAFA